MSPRPNICAGKKIIEPIIKNLEARINPTNKTKTLANEEINKKKVEQETQRTIEQYEKYFKEAKDLHKPIDKPAPIKTQSEIITNNEKEKKQEETEEKRNKRRYVGEL